MGFEGPPQTSPKPEDEGRMSNEAAHKEANMINAKLKVSPETGEMAHLGSDRERAGWKPTKEDYENAFKEVEDIVEMAEQDPEKGGTLMAKAMRVAIRFPEFAVRLNGIIDKAVFAQTAPEFLKEEAKEELKRSVDALKERYKFVIQTPQENLEDLKTDAEEFSRKQREGEGM